MVKRRLMAIGAATVIATGVAWAAGDWSAAKSRFDNFKDAQQALKKMTPEETKKIVQAICEARSTKERREVGKTISSRVKSDLNDSLDKLKGTRDEAIRLLDDVIGDSELSSNHNDAQRMKEEVKERWEMIERMTQALRGGNHPGCRSCPSRVCEPTASASKGAMPTSSRWAVGERIVSWRAERPAR